MLDSEKEGTLTLKIYRMFLDDEITTRRLAGLENQNDYTGNQKVPQRFPPPRAMVAFLSQDSHSVPYPSGQRCFFCGPNVNAHPTKECWTFKTLKQKREGLTRNG